MVHALNIHIPSFVWTPFMYKDQTENHNVPWPQDY